MIFNTYDDEMNIRCYVFYLSNSAIQISNFLKILSNYSEISLVKSNKMSNIKKE